LGELVESVNMEDFDRIDRIGSSEQQVRTKVADPAAVEDADVMLVRDSEEGRDELIRVLIYPTHGCDVNTRYPDEFIS
jgi:hypothetical protein